MKVAALGPRLGVYGKVGSGIELHALRLCRYRDAVKIGGLGELAQKGRVARIIVKLILSARFRSLDALAAT
jgi:hypothetical protein